MELLVVQQNVSEFNLIDVSGKFIKDESILINGVQNGRVITKVDSFGFNDVKIIKECCRCVSI